MASIRLFPLNWRFSKDDGSFAFTDGTISFYVGGTGNSSKTPITVYTDKDLATGPRTTVSIDSDGYPAYEQIWGDDSNSYDIGVLATGFNGGVEKVFPYAELAASAASANTDSALAFKNALDNGAFSVWTGLTSFSNISGSAAAAEVADDWFFSQNGTASNTITRQAADKTGARYGLRMGRPAASTSAEQLRLYQALPTDEAYRMRGQTVTVSFNLKKGADFSGSNVAILIATGTAEGESGNLMATGGWTGQVSALNQTQVPTTTSVRYQFSATLASNIKEAGLQLSYTPSGTAGSNDWIQIEDVQWEVGGTATDFVALPEVIEFLRSNTRAAAQPYFRANKNGTNQTGIADITNTKVTFTTEAVDNGGYYDTTNSRWTPPAGPVLLTAYATITGTFTAGNEMNIVLYKNGAALAPSGSRHVAAVGGSGVVLVAFDVANGTDYYEIYVYADVSSGTATVVGSTSLTGFQGVWLG